MWQDPVSNVIIMPDTGLALWPTVYYSTSLIETGGGMNVAKTSSCINTQLHQPDQGGWPQN